MVGAVFGHSAISDFRLIRAHQIGARVCAVIRLAGGALVAGVADCLHCSLPLRDDAIICGFAAMSIRATKTSGDGSPALLLHSKMCACVSCTNEAVPAKLLSM